MSGAITATTIATIGMAAAAGAGTAYSIYSGQKQAGMQKKALKNQVNAQNQAEQRALSTRRQAETAQNAANQKTPDLASILERAATSGAGGVGGTMLTGPGGVNPGTLTLGKSSLLGS